eukprot:10803950-Lingulodinium_polyedra.AAC.1
MRVILEHLLSDPHRRDYPNPGSPRVRVITNPEQSRPFNHAPIQDRPIVFERLDGRDRPSLRLDRNKGFEWTIGWPL